MNITHTEPHHELPTGTVFGIHWKAESEGGE